MSRLILDTVERTVAAYVTTLLGLLLATGFDLTDISALKAAAIAAVPAALSVLKAAVGSLVGDPRTVGWIPRDGR
ncbi:holin [Streptomyces tsukubensis]